MFETGSTQGLQDSAVLNKARESFAGKLQGGGRVSRGLGLAVLYKWDFQGLDRAKTASEGMSASLWGVAPIILSPFPVPPPSCRPFFLPSPLPPQSFLTQRPQPVLKSPRPHLPQPFKKLLWRLETSERGNFVCDTRKQKPFKNDLLGRVCAFG